MKLLEVDVDKRGELYDCMTKWPDFLISICPIVLLD